MHTDYMWDETVETRHQPTTSSRTKIVVDINAYDTTGCGKIQFVESCDEALCFSSGNLSAF